MTDPLVDYALASLRRASDNAFPWSLTPTEAGALVAEVEYLRGERAAVVAWLRRVQPGWPSGSGGHADAIERGEHRREREHLEDDSIEYRDIAKED